MKKLASLFLAFLSSLSFAGPGDLEMSQYDQFGVGRILRLMPIPAGNASGVVVYDGVTTWPRIATLGTGLSYSSGVISASAPAFDYGYPAVRSLSLSTSYQASNPAKAAIIKVSPACTASLSLAVGGTCTLQARVHNAPVTCSTGVIDSTWTNENTGTLTIGLGLNQRIGGPGDIQLPIGGYFILCPVSGTFTIVTATERTAG